MWESGGHKRPLGGGAEKGTIENKKGGSGPSPQTLVLFGSVGVWTKSVGLGVSSVGVSVFELYSDYTQS